MGTVAAARRSAVTLRPAPRIGLVLREQLALAGLQLRGLGLLAAAAMAVITTMIAWWHLSRGSGANFVLPDMSLAGLLGGTLAPLALWRGEGPSRRGYFLAQPIGRLAHTLARLLAGWTWLMGAVALFLAWALALALATGSDVSIGLLRTRVLQPELAATGALLDLGMASNAWLWLVPFTSATVLYLLVSLAMLATDQPWRWFGGLAFATLVVSALLDSSGHGVPLLVHDTLLGRYGVEAVLMGLSDQRVDPSLVPATAEGQIDLPDLRAWATSTAMLALTALAALVLVARRQEER